MSAALTAHLRLGARTPFAWGSADCTLWPCDWVLQRRGVDPAAPLRGRYRTQLGAARHITRHGGMQALCRDFAAAAGLVTTDAPQPGDIGLVRHPLAGPAMALRLPLGWAIKAPRGISVAEFETIVAWRV